MNWEKYEGYVVFVVIFAIMIWIGKSNTKYLRDGNPHPVCVACHVKYGGYSEPEAKQLCLQPISKATPIECLD